MAAASGGLRVNSPAWDAAHSSRTGNPARIRPRVRSNRRGRTSGRRAIAPRWLASIAALMVVYSWRRQISSTSDSGATAHPIRRPGIP